MYKQKKPDTRTFMFIIVLCAISIFYLKSIRGMILLQGSILLLEIILKEKELFFKNTITYGIMLLLFLMLGLFGNSYIVGVFSLFLLLMIRMYPVFTLVTLWVNRIPLDEMMISLQRLKLPNYIVLTLIVVIRYMPTIGHEASYIVSNIAMQQTKKSKMYYLRHFGKGIEMIIVPLLIRSTKISDELSDSALTKGYRFEQKISSVTDVRFGVLDKVLCVSSILVTSGIVFL